MIKLKETLYVQRENGNFCTARFRIREKKVSKFPSYKLTHRYLYLTYRDGKKIKEVYITKLENGSQHG